MDRLLEHPNVKVALNSVGGFVDKLSGFLSFANGLPSVVKPNGANGAQRPHTPPPSPKPTGMTSAQARLVLGFDGERLTKDLVKTRQRAMAKVLHPDLKGGSTAAMQRLNEAANILLKECR